MNSEYEAMQAAPAVDVQIKHERGAQNALKYFYMHKEIRQNKTQCTDVREQPSQTQTFHANILYTRA